LISEAVSELTERAVKPTLEPFGRALRDATDQLQQRIEALEALFDAQASELQAGRDRTVEQLRLLEEKLHGQVEESVRLEAQMLAQLAQTTQQHAEGLTALGAWSDELGQVHTEALTGMAQAIHDHENLNERSMAELSSVVRDRLDDAQRHHDATTAQLLALIQDRADQNARATASLMTMLQEQSGAIADQEERLCRIAHEVTGLRAQVHASATEQSTQTAHLVQIPDLFAQTRDGVQRSGERAEWLRGKMSELDPIMRSTRTLLGIGLIVLFLEIVAILFLR
jgi:hypothetical protein